MKHLAILARTYEAGVSWLASHSGTDLIGTYVLNRSTMSGRIQIAGVDRPFVIISDSIPRMPERLRGYELIGYVEVGAVSPQLVDLARAMVRD